MRQKTIKFYLAGPIGDTDDSHYLEWRQDMTKFLRSIGLDSLDPCEKYEGEDLVGSVGDWKDHLFRLRKEGEFGIVRNIMQEYILPSDLYLVEKSDGLIAYIPEYTIGTTREISFAYYWKKPVYIITQIKYPSNSLIGMCERIFRTFDELKEFLRVKYHGSSNTME